jgi:uncharacterized protein (TIGR02996 family)
MNDGEALLAAILANPDDDTPRLVYADWLDEHDESARAEFIRVQIALVHAPTLALRAREAALLATHETAWLSALKAEKAPLYGEAHGKFRRGFIEVVWMSTTAFLERAKDLFTSVPLRELRLTTTTMVQLAELVHCPLFERLAGLDLSDWRMRDAAAIAVLRSRKAGSLRVLRLRGCGITDEGAYGMATVTVNWSLRELDVSHNPISSAGVEALRNRYGDAVIAEGMIRTV